MKPILYPENETAFDTNGIGVLSDVISCRVKEAMNGQYELTIKYPTTGIHYAEIINRAIIMVKPNPVSDPQPFRVYHRVPASAGTVTIYARHVAYDLAGITTAPFTATGAASALQGMKDNAVTDCPFEFWTDKDTGNTLTVSTPKAIWTLLGGSAGSVLDVFGGEYEFDRFTVKLNNRRGADRGVSIRYGKNLTSLEQDENCANCCTGVYPYWTDAEGGQLVQLPEKIVNAPGTYSYVRVPPLDLSAEWQEPPTEDQLRARAEKYVKDNNVGVPVISWKVEFVQLEQTEEYKDQALLERVLLGDTVSVDFPAMGVSASARVSETDFDALLERYESVTLGSVRANIASTIAQQQQTIEKVQSPSFYQAAVNRATNWITNGRGYMVAVRDANGNWVELCSLDDPDISQAVNVWRWNNGGLGHSANGYNGPYHVAITQDGQIVADFITTGTLNAEKVKIINLIVDHLVSEDDNFKLEIYDSSIEMTDKAHGATWQVRNFEDGLSYMYFTKYNADGTTDDSQYGPHAIGLGGEGFVDFDVFIASRYFNGKSMMSIDAVERADPDKPLEVEGYPFTKAGILNLLAFNKTLFEGECAIGGTCAAANVLDYTLFAITLAEEGNANPCTPIIAKWRTGGSIEGVGGWAGTSENKKALYFATLQIVGDNADIYVADARSNIINADGTLNSTQTMKLVKLEGLL